jgi:hypothetical protein
MSNILRRLQKLEAHSTDRSGYPPHSQAWPEYWLGRLNQILSEGEPGTPGCIPLEVWDAISLEVERGESEGAGSQDRTMTTGGESFR